jgi:hypothetical protein
MSLKSFEETEYHRAITETYLYDTSFKMKKSAYDVVGSFLQKEELCAAIGIIDALSGFKPINVKDNHRFIANKLIEDNKYNF